VYTDSDQTVLQHVVVSGGGGPSHHPQASVLIDRSAPTLDQVSIRHSLGQGISVASNRLIALSGLLIEDNTSDGIFIAGNVPAIAIVAPHIHRNGGYGISVIGNTTAISISQGVMSNNGVAARLPADTFLSGNTWQGNTRNEIEFENGMIAGVQHWPSEGAAYRLISNVTVQDGARLSIAAGTQIVLDQDSYLTVYGDIQAIGTVSQPITFTAPNGSAPGSWAQVTIGGGSILTDSDASQLRHVIMRGGGGPAAHPQAMLRIERSAPVMDHLVLEKSAGPGLHAFAAESFHLSNATIAENGGDGIYLQGTCCVKKRSRYGHGERLNINRGRVSHTTQTDC
jgi:hypothetical protein